jgi:hypothetical protein
VPPATGSRIDKADEEKETSGKVSEGMYHILFDGRDCPSDRC